MDSTSFPLDNYLTMTDIVYAWLKNAIISSEFRPGQHLTQDMIAKRLQVSRSPVRDAFNRLQSEGFLVLRPHIGAVVQNLSLNKLIEIYELRSLLEGPAARYACQKITDEGIETLESINRIMIQNQQDASIFMNANRAFHTTLYGFSGREYLVNHIFQLWDLTEPYRLMYVADGGKTGDSIQEHVLIIEALRRRDEDDVEHVIRSHLNEVVSTLAKQPPYLSD